MAGKLRDIKRRIGSVKSTQKITRAMELIASSRIIRAQQRVAAARPYADAMKRLMSSVVSHAGRLDHPLLKELAFGKDVKEDGVGRVGLVVISSDRGLAGAYNANVIRAAESDLQSHDLTELFVVGKKAAGYFRFRGYAFEHSWTGMSDRPRVEDAKEVAAAVAKVFAAGELSEVRLAYTLFVSALVQRPVVIRLLPVVAEEMEREERAGPSAAYLFEPAPEEILGFLFPRYVEGLVYQAMLEAVASEHAARRRAMKAATDNAEELVDNLTRVYNQVRQAEITTEIMEVVGGAEALMTAVREK